MDMCCSSKIGRVQLVWAIVGWMGVHCVVGLPSNVTNTTISSTSIGHCVMNGVQFTVGERWPDTADPCILYECMADGKYEVVAPETMSWPDGTYAMLKPRSGCPVDTHNSWTEGGRIQNGADQNAYTNSLSGNYSAELMQQELCIHQDVTNTSGKFKSRWEPGRYCLLRHGGDCPKDFTHGHVVFDSSKPTNGSVNDTTPGANNGVTLHFCCRTDGLTGQEIVLPVNNSFILFMSDNETECQNVKGMADSKNMFTLQGISSSKLTLNGTLPMMTNNNSEVLLSYCVYTPAICVSQPGCLDQRGGFIALDTERYNNCVLERCMTNPQNGMYMMHVVQGGCPVEGRCEAENSVWAVDQGQACTSYTCMRMQNDTDIWFDVLDVNDGCMDNDTCMPMGTQIQRGCYTYTCIQGNETGTNLFAAVSAECPWLGACKPVNSTWLQGCVRYECKVNLQGPQFTWSVEPVEYGCDDGNGTCYKVGERAIGKCYDAVCRLNANETMVYLDVSKGGCPWNDQCKKVNDTWNDGCHDYKCEWTETETGFTAVVNATNVSCEWNNTCYRPNQVWTVGCVDYKCSVARHKGEVNWGVETTNVACQDFNGNCLTVGDSITERCVTYRCNHVGNRIGLDPVSVGCEMNGDCKQENVTWTDKKKCVSYQCQKKRGATGSVMQISVISYGCVFNDTCKDVNETWPDGCRTRKCSVQKLDKAIQRSIAPIEAGCDDEGICRPVGFKKMTNSCMEYECRFNTEYKDAFFTLSSGACRMNGQCHVVDSQWERTINDTCLTYKCRREKVGYLSKLIEQRCRGSDGTCRSVGTTAFPAVINGKQHTNCSCVAAVKPVKGISISCTT